MKKTTFFIIITLVVLVTACGTRATPNPTNGSSGTTVSFKNDVNPILQSRCISCHSGAQASMGLSFDTYDSLMAGSYNGPVIKPGDPTNSLLVQLVQIGAMPKRGPELTPEQIQTLIDWIQAGAPNN